MIFLSHREQPFYGSVTVGERGQVVIPVRARKRFNIGSGDKLLAFGVPGGGVAFFKVESISRFISTAMGRLSSMEKVLAETSKEPDQGLEPDASDESGRRKTRS